MIDTFGRLLDKIRVDFAESLNIGFPMMDTNQVLWQVAKHIGQFVGCHAFVSSKRGHNVQQAIAEHIIGEPRQFARAAVAARVIGRKGEHFLRVSHGVESSL